MPVKLNLLPQEFLVSKSLNSVLKTVRAMNVILSVAFIIFALGVGGYFLISRNTLNSTESKVDQLKTQVLAQESSEQQLILLKDRLAKISTVGSSQGTLKSIDNVDALLNGLSTNTSIEQMDAGSSKIDLSVIIKSNADLTKFMGNVADTNSFKSITLTSFGYSPLTGYALGLSFGEN
jgi:hypothetical protein